MAGASSSCCDLCHGDPGCTAGPGCDTVEHVETLIAILVILFLLPWVVGCLKPLIELMVLVVGDEDRRPEPRQYFGFEGRPLKSDQPGDS